MSRAKLGIAMAVAAATLVTTVTGTVTASAADQATSGYDLRVGSFNVRNVAYDLSPSPGESPWKVRRGAVIRDVLGENTDVLGVQEASQNTNYGAGHGAPGHYVDGHMTLRSGTQVTNVATQYFDLRNGLNDKTAGRPWAMTNGYLYNCERLDSNSNCSYRDRGASRDTRILYRMDRLALVRAGSYLYEHQSGGANDQRYLVWAEFRIKQTGAHFFFANTHLATGAASLRQAEWNELISKVNSLKAGLPAVVTGDFQSTKWNFPSDTMMTVMHSNGYGDVVNQTPDDPRLTAPRPQTMVNSWINSFNAFHRDLRTFSYYDKRIWVGNNCDWIFATNSLAVKRWKVVAHYDPTTLQLTGVIPSDHNMVSSTVTIP